MVWWQRLLNVIVWISYVWCGFLVIAAVLSYFVWEPLEAGVFWATLLPGVVPVIVALLLRKAVNYVVNG